MIGSRRGKESESGSRGKRERVREVNFEGIFSQPQISNLCGLE